nr:hypothetical protein [Limosilactobacillus mucosae]
MEMINLAFWNKPDPDKPKQNGFEKYGEKYINENFLQDVDPKYHDMLNQIGFSENFIMSAPTFTSNDTKTLDHELRMIKMQNTILIRQNDEIIKELRKLNRPKSE